MHNPGTPPDAPLASTADVIVTCEESLQRYQRREVRTHYARFNYTQPMSACLISATPPDEIAGLTQNLRRTYAYLFVTDLAHNFYERFSSSLEGFVYALE
jgi:Leu/Phe-tRNA-protein transferase